MSWWDYRYNAINILAVQYHIDRLVSCFWKFSSWLTTLTLACDVSLQSWPTLLTFLQLSLSCRFSPIIWLGSEPFHVKFPLIVTSPSQNSIAPQTFPSQYKNTCFIFKVKKKDQMTCYFFHLWIWQMDLVLNNFASYQNVKLSLKLKFMQILVPPHRGHKLCKPSSGKETIKYKPWGILLAYSETLFEIHTKTISLKT